ncbi:MAG: DUF2283 domain-containing protein [Dehalococcoidia bacterium]
MTPETDALYIGLREAQARDAVDIEEGVLVDLDKDGHIIGLEVLDASERLTPEELGSINFESLLLTMPEDEVEPEKRVAAPSGPRLTPEAACRIVSAAATALSARRSLNE